MSLIKVGGWGRALTKSYQLGAVEITAPQEVDANPSVIEIKSKDFKDTGSDNVAQAVRMTPGIMFNEAHGQRGEAGMAIRGYGRNQIGLYLDGIPVMSIYDRNTDYGQFVTQGISSIQISKGFTSPVYDINSLGGAINLVSSKPEKELEFSFRGKYLSPDEAQGGVSIGTNQGKYYFQVDYSYTDRDTYKLSKDYEGTIIQPKGDKKNAYYTNHTAKVKLGFQPNENHEYSLNYIHQFGKKGGLMGSEGGALWDWPHYDKNTLYLLGNSYFTPDLSLNTRLYYDRFYNELNMKGRYTIANDGSLNYQPRPIGTSIYDDDSYGAILTLGYDITQNSNLKFGVNVKRDHHQETFNDDSDLTELTTSVFAQYAQGFGIFRFVLASSYDRADMLNVRLVQTQTTQGATTSHINTDKTSIKGDFSVQGALYADISEGQNIHLSVGKKTNLPTLRNRYSSVWGQNIANPNLKVESAINYEVGYDLNLASTTFTIAGFYNDITDMLATRQVVGDCANANNGLCSQYYNANQGYTYGGEVGLEQGFFEDNMFVLGGNYSYIYKKAKGSSSDNTLAGTKITDYPNHIFNAKIAFKPIRSLEFIALSTLESARYYASGAEYLRNNNFFTLDLSANYELFKGFLLNAGVSNVTDRDNYLIWNSSQSHLAGRRYFIGFDYKY